MTTPALFGFEGVTVRRGGGPVISSATFSIPAAGVTVVMGPSGAGKSSLLRLCNRLDVPDTGSISYRGGPIESLDPRWLRRRVGMVFQHPVPFGGTVAEGLGVVTDDEAAWAAALHRVGLDPSFLGRPDTALSGGEAQRYCLARTLLTEPDCLLMDEPTSALDIDASARIEQLGRELAETGTPVVWVTHDPGQRDRLADHCLSMAGGQVSPGAGG